MRTCSRTRPVRSASCNAKASGAFREPGQSTTSRTPPRISSSTTTRACVVEGFTSTACHKLLTGRRAWSCGAVSRDFARQVDVGRLPFLGEELEHGGVDGVGPLEEAEMTGVGYLHVTAVGQRVR